MATTIASIQERLAAIDEEIVAATASLRAEKNRLRRELMGMVKRDAGTLDRIIPFLIDDNDAIADTTVENNDSGGFRLIVLFNSYTDDDSYLINLLETIVTIEYLGSDSETNGKWCEYRLAWK